MKRVLPWLICTLLGACALLPENELGRSGSSGTVNADSSLAMVAIATNAAFTPNPSSEPGDEVQNPRVEPEVNRFATTFANRFARELPGLLKTRGVAVHAPGVGIPLLRAYASSYRAQCRYQRDPCPTEVRIDVALLEGGGSRSWWYYAWVVPEEMDDSGYRAFYQDLFAAMIKDQVIAR